MLLIYTDKITNRVQYCFQFIFKEYFSIPFQFIDEIEIFRKSHLPKLNYSQKIIDRELFFYASPLLFEASIYAQQLKVKTLNDIPVFFLHDHSKAVLPFDLFALVFYNLTRYEEYTNTFRDKHDRFSAKESLAFQNDFLHLPIVDLWLLELKKILKKHFPSLFFQPKSYAFLPTYDIDYAWSYKNKGLYRTIGGYLRDLLAANFRQFKQRLNVQLGLVKDPFFKFDYLKNLHSESSIKPIYFFLIGKLGEYDKNISLKSPIFRQLIQRISAQYKVGIHPSYQSNDNINLLSLEQSNLSKVIGKPIKISRQHFLRLKLPITYRNLLTIGIQEDYTMGYSDVIGFRASTCTPFYWFDLEKEETTTLKVIPFQVMDVTLKNYLKLSATDAVEEVKKLVAVTKEVEGLFVTLWHNSSFCEQDGWEGWTRAYEEMMEELGII